MTDEIPSITVGDVDELSNPVLLDVREIDEHTEILSAAHRFQTARDARKIGKRGRGFFGRHAESLRNGNCRQCVVDVVASDERQ